MCSSADSGLVRTERRALLGGRDPLVEPVGGQRPVLLPRQMLQIEGRELRTSLRNVILEEESQEFMEQDAEQLLANWTQTKKDLDEPLPTVLITAFEIYFSEKRVTKPFQSKSSPVVFW